MTENVEAPVRVVRLAPHEWPRLRAIRLRALQDTPDAFTSTLDEALARPAKNWSRQLRDMPAFVAVKNGIDVGIVRGVPDDLGRRTVWLISMWVAPEARKSGIGGALVDAVIDWARSQRAVRLLLDVADDNAPAIALYARKGFTPNGEVGRFPPPRQHIGEHRRELRLTSP